MPCTANGLYVVQGEMAILLAAMRRGNRWSTHSAQDINHDVLIQSFNDLKDVLNQLGDLKDLDPNHYFGPFLEVIRAGDITGPVTSLALSSVHKFLSYRLIDMETKSLATTLENIADAVTHTRFVSTDANSDGIVLMKILPVLRALVISPTGFMLTNESICEIMLSCFRICFEPRLSEHLRKSAEFCLKDLVQHIFSKLHEFTEEQRISTHVKKLKMNKGYVNLSDGKSRKRTKSSSHRRNLKNKDSSVKNSSNGNLTNDKYESNNIEVVSDGSLSSLETVTSNIVDMQGQIHQDDPVTPVETKELNENVTDVVEPTSKETSSSLDENEMIPNNTQAVVINVEADREEKITGSLDNENNSNLMRECDSLKLTDKDVKSTLNHEDTKSSVTSEDYVNPRGVRFTSDVEGPAPLVPYNLSCVRELFIFLISLCNPLDRQNTEAMIQVGLSLLTVAFEVGADGIGKYNVLLNLVKDELCRNLFSLLQTERISIFATDLQLSFLLFESLRTHLKFQFEYYLTKLTEMIVSDSPKVTYEQKEIALESVVQLWRIPGLVTELYLNYDCDLYCPNLFEELTKLLSKNAFPVAGIYNTHLLSLDALLTIIDAIECHCHNRIMNERQNNGVVSSDVSEAKARALMAASGRGSRQKISENIPSHEQLMAIKRRKKLLNTGSEQFNTKPKKGIQFLQEHHLLSTPINPHEVVHFLRENPHLDKKMIGEYISNRNNLEVLDTFVKSFDFVETRIDEALRLYLETFRLPGESPVISLIMEHFADHWHKCNGEPFANADAAFTLAYAVIMLNVDQHNHNVKRQNNPMTVEDFKKNLKKVNGGEDFDEEMLNEIYTAIRNEEIVMPAEQTGQVKENYLWKVLLRRGSAKDGVYLHAPNGLFDHDLFSLIWSPTIVALSYVFDKSNDVSVYQKAISGFRKCAMISAHYGMSADFDNLVISLCKFTNLTTSLESPDQLTITFGSNMKAQLAAKTMFNLTHRHGDIMREGWRNVLEIILQLYKCKLLPKCLIEAEDFIEQSGKIILVREEVPSQKVETGLLSSLYSYIALGSEAGSQRMPSLEDQEHIKAARYCIKECHLEQIITESKFLRMDSLQELVKSLIILSNGPSPGSTNEEDSAVFFLELLIKIVIQNRDRAATIWPSVRDHIYSSIMASSASDQHFLMERSIVGLLRLAIRLMRREEMSSIVLQSLRILLLLKPSTLQRVSRQIAYGLYEMLKTSAANIHTSTDWTIIFTLLECIGAGALPPRVSTTDGQQNSDQGNVNYKSSIQQDLSVQDFETVSVCLNALIAPAHIECRRDRGQHCLVTVGAKSEGDVGSGSNEEEDSGVCTERGYTSDSELASLKRKVTTAAAAPTGSQQQPTSPEMSPNTGGGWILVGREGEIQLTTINQFEQELSSHDAFALVKCCESLAFLVRDVAHITPYNFENCVHCIRTFVEASLNGNKQPQMKKLPVKKDPKSRKKSSKKREEVGHRARSPQMSPTSAYDADESDPEEFPSGYHQISIQLLDLMHTLHTRTAQIYRWWAEENKETEITSLWAQGWCPLLQGIARLCCDSRKQVRMSAITYLQRALLVHDLQTLSPDEWESCFNKVLFPLLSKLLELEFYDETHLEETRMRASTVLSKVFLHHLTPLLSLPTFTGLWLKILDFMDKYMNIERCDLLSEAIPESLKNMLLVMDSAKVFTTSDEYSQLWDITWDRIDMFLPCLKDEFLKSRASVPRPMEGDLDVTQEESSVPVNVPGTLPEPTLLISPTPCKTTVTVGVSQNVYQPVGKGTSIILQPPQSAFGSSFTTPIFSHLGQQMPTTNISSSVAQPDMSPPSPPPMDLPPLPDQEPEHSGGLNFGSRGSAFVPYVNPDHQKNTNKPRQQQQQQQQLIVSAGVNIVPPVQMFSSISHTLYDDGLNNTSSLLSQYFHQSGQHNQQQQVFDELISSGQVDNKISD